MTVRQLQSQVIQKDGGRDSLSHWAREGKQVEMRHDRPAGAFALSNLPDDAIRQGA
jgi:hypothetical protein